VRELGAGRQGRGRACAGGAVRVRAYLEAELACSDAEAVDTFEELALEKRELLGPSGGGDVQREHAASQPPRLRARRDAVAHGAPPRFAVDDDTARTSAHVARLLEQGAERRRRT